MKATRTVYLPTKPQLITYVEPGQSSVIEARNSSNVRVQAPWSSLAASREWKSFLGKEGADIVIILVIKQLLPKFTLVFRQEDAVQFAKLRHAK
ncbi:hypothetical protein FEM48_Zijuj11G0086400 [Ziziphus jujuba var. spinosa]|uniref:Uncharacterized protein n=1 Tax=Ziziphus jujuba var. spinosa TaxID=714518 RepID=A0A978UHX6_ZIZJJ|nr:hypothetical protein FEM48_Zijuj11G0086400 [Ziziphus jujuba var. spinosa]